MCASNQDDFRTCTIVVGFCAKAAQCSISIGPCASANALAGIGIGDTVTANSNYSIAIGYRAYALGPDNIIAIGCCAKSEIVNGIAIGAGACATAAGAVAIGCAVVAATANTLTTNNLQLLGQGYSDIASKGFAGGTIAIDFNDGNVQHFTGNNTNVTLTFSNMKAGATYIIWATQGSTGGNTITWPATVYWPNNTVPVWTATANKNDIFSIVVYDNNLQVATAVQNFG
jgi:hypothetical protein